MDKRERVTAFINSGHHYLTCLCFQSTRPAVTMSVIVTFLCLQLTQPCNGDLCSTSAMIISCSISAIITYSVSLVYVEPACSDELLLYFPFDVDFDDVSCHNAKGYAYGYGMASIVNDAERGNVVHFDGSVRIEVSDVNILLRQFGR